MLDGALSLSIIDSNSAINHRAISKSVGNLVKAFEQGATKSPIFNYDILLINFLNKNFCISNSKLLAYVKNALNYTFSIGYVTAG